MRIFLYILLYFFLNLYTISASSLFYSGVIQCSIIPFVSKENLLADSIKPVTNELPANPLDPSRPIEGVEIYMTNGYQEQDLNYLIAQQMLQLNSTGISGIIAYYKGFASLSDAHGIIIFPRFEEQFLLKVLVTPYIEAVKARNEIPEYFTLSHNTPYKYYECKGEVNEDETTITWQADPLELQNPQKIPSNTLIIIADPEALFFDNEPRKVPYSQNFLLPPLRAQLTITRGIYGILAMDTLQFYKPLLPIKRKTVPTSPGAIAQEAQFYTDDVIHNESKADVTL